MRNRALVAALLLGAAIAFNLVTLWPEVAVETPTLNDNTMHLPLVERAVQALERGENPTDPWVPYFVEGYPLFHYYQHLPHVVTALLYRGLAIVPLGTLFRWVSYLLLSTFPLSIYWAGRRLGFGAVPAALAGTLASLLATNGLYGLDMASYVWRGYGLFTQLWGMWLLGPAVAGLYVTLKEGRSYAGTAALVAATLLAHTVLGYVALLSGALFVVLAGTGAIGRRLLRLALVFLLVALLASYFLVPFVRDQLYMNRSVWEDAGKYDAYGWEWTLQTLATGQLLDYGRFPSLTILGALGLVVCALRWRDERYRLAAAFFLFWIVLYFGRPTWGVLLNLLPLSQNLQLHRLIAPVHLGAIALAGAGLAWLWERTYSFRQRWPLVVAAVLTVGLLVPVYYDRTAYLVQNGQWMAENAAAFSADGGAMDTLLADLRTLPPGRVYAGRSANWGKDYRIGDVPIYALLAQNGFDSPGHLYHALSLNADIEGYLDESRPATFNLFNMRYVIVPQDQPAPTFAHLVASYGRHRLYQVDTTGYFDLVDSDFTFYGNQADWFPAMQAWVQSTWVEARQHPAIVLGPAPAGDPAARPLHDAPALLAKQAPPQYESCGRLWGEQVGGNVYAVEFNAERACWLLFKGTFHPGWQATVDGQPVETSMLAPSFVGLRVEPGRHQAVLRYEPGSLRTWLMVAGLVVLLLAALAEWQHERWQNALRRLVAPLARRWAPLEPAWQRLRAWASAHWRNDWVWIVLLLFFVLLAGLPTLQLRQMSGHDDLEYLPRAVEFYRGLTEGHIFPRWAPDLSQGYGQPFFIFNPPLVYYAAAAFHVLGISLVASLNLVCLVLLVLAGLGMYFFSREFFGRPGGLVAGVAYVLAPFTLVNLYVRYALTDYAAMAFIPWALWGLWGWVYLPHRRVVPVKGSGRGYLLVASGSVALLLLSSNPVALVAVPLLAIYCVFLARRVRSSPALGRGAWAIGLGLGLAAFFWLPALFESHSVKLGNLLSGYLDYRNHFVYLHQLIFSRWGYGLSLPGANDGMSFGLGLVYLLTLAASLLLARSRRAQLRDAGEGWPHFWFFVGVLAATVFLVTDNSIALWDGLPLLQYLEFPWRILVLAALATSFICAFPFLAVRGHPRERWLLLILLMGLFLTGMPHAHPKTFYDITDADYAPAVIAARGLEVTTTAEYEPAWAAVRPADPSPPGRLLLLSGQVRILESQVSGTRYEWQVQATGPARLQVATFYYPGWSLKVDGQPRPLSVSIATGLMEFALEGGNHRVEVTFGLTPLRGWAVGISWAAVLLLAVTLALGRLRRSLRPR